MIDIKLSLRKYMLIDLTILIVVGVIAEYIGTRVSGLVLGAAPTFTFSFLVAFVAIMRWNFWGLLIVPFLAGATVLGGGANTLPYFAAVYDWRIYLSACVGLSVLSVNIIFFKKFGTKRVMLNIYAVIGLLFLSYFLYNEVFKMMYRLLCTGNPFELGKILFDGEFYEEGKDELVVQTVNLCKYVENIGVYNLFGLVVAFVGVFVLRSQGVVNNVVDKLIEDKKIQAEILAAENFEILEVEKLEEKGESNVFNEDSHEN